MAKRKEFLIEITKLDVDGLKAKAKDLSEELFKLRIRHKSGQLETSHRLNEVKKNLARTLTELGKKKQAV